MNKQGFCVCHKCKYYMPAMLGIDCSCVKCPICNEKMESSGYHPLK